ncbi:MAG: ABC transporter permease [Prevotella sp.]|jgi:putative ABC transport system permease protein|nr:ABC transporter permease [Prevotella sp.]
MYKIYFKQAIEMLRQNKFISIITIIGTALAIMMIMVIIVTDSIKKTSIPPEINRDRVMYLKNEIKKSKDEKGMQSNGVISYEIYKGYLSDLKKPELVSLQQDSWNKAVVTTAENEMDRMGLKLKITDANFWKIMDLTFVGGSPYSEEDFKSGLKKAVITEETAKKLYGNESALGKTINVDFNPYVVIGIIKDISPIFNYAHSDIYIPFTSRGNYKEDGFLILLLAKDKSDFNAISEEIRAAERKFNATDTKWNLTLMGPFNHSVQLLNASSNEEPNAKGYHRKMIFILSLLLLIPAINLSSFSLSRIKKRIEEIGVRKAFGAKKHMILVQVLYENFITSLIGGIIGLILSYIVVIWLKQWLLGIESGSSLPIETFVSIPIFVAVFIVCMLLNLLSAGIPAYRASRIKIVDSLSKNQES